MGFENNEAVIDHIVENRGKNNNWNESDFRGLAAECWESLDGEVKEAYRNGEKKVGDKQLNGFDDFRRSMDRLQNSYVPNDKEEAVLNFKFVDRSNHANEVSVFDSRKIISSLQSQKSLSQFPLLASNVATQLSTLTTKNSLEPEKEEKLLLAMSSILVGVVTDKNKLLHTRSIDESKVDGQGKIHPELVMAIGAFVSQNLDKLPSDEKELKRLGTSFKNGLGDFNLDTGPRNNQHFMSKLLTKLNESYKNYHPRGRVSSLEVATNMTSHGVVEGSPETVYSNSPNKEKGFFR